MDRMRRCYLFPLVVCVVAVPLATPVAAQDPLPPAIRELRIDPMLLVSVKEYRNIIKAIGPDIYPGWDAETIPLLLYRPLVQDVLLNSPRRPPGFGRLTAHTPLGDEVIYARNDTTVRDTDGQNTAITFDSMRVLVVADRYSRERSHIRGTLQQPAIVDQWLNEWGFIESPYDEVELILHEAFHVHQQRLAPEKSADERAVARYPLLDATNNALVALEARLLRDAVLAPNDTQRRSRAAQFAAVRALRRAGLDTASITYENLNEYVEGTGKYVEYRFLELGDRVTPIAEMYYYNGFRGYRDVLRRRLQHRMDDMVKIASFGDNRFGNKFGGGPMRFRLYYTGAAQAMLLDHIAPNWKERIFAPGVYLSDLLTQALSLSHDQQGRMVSQAKADFGYDSIYSNRQTFEAEGRRIVQEKLRSILETRQTLVVIDYSETGDLRGMGYTPFGVTAVDDHTAIYDLTPIAVGFANRAVLRMKSVIPVVVDRRSRTVTFAIPTPAVNVAQLASKGVDTQEFSLSGSGIGVIERSNNVVRIRLIPDPAS